MHGGAKRKEFAIALFRIIVDERFPRRRSNKIWLPVPGQLRLAELDPRSTILNQRAPGCFGANIGNRKHDDSGKTRSRNCCCQPLLWRCWLSQDYMRVIGWREEGSGRIVTQSEVDSNR